MGLHLLDLPVDLLHLMLRPLLVSRERIQLCPCAGPPVDVRPLALLLTHPAVHAVACPLLYEGNVFALDVRGEHGPHVRRCLSDAGPGGGGGGGGGGAAAAAAAGKTGRGADDDDDNDDDEHGDGPSPLLLQRSALRRIGRVEVRVARLRAWLDWHVVPLLSDMALGGALAELDVYVHPPGGHQHQNQNQHQHQHQRQRLARPPMTGLLRVLADPYLRRASLLWVPGGNEPAAEVDWRQLVRDADPRRHRVVGLGPDVRAARGGG